MSNSNGQHETTARRLIEPVSRKLPWPGEYSTEPPSAVDVALANVHIGFQIVEELRALRQSIDNMRASVEASGGAQ